MSEKKRSKPLIFLIVFTFFLCLALFFGSLIINVNERKAAKEDLYELTDSFGRSKDTDLEWYDDGYEVIIIGSANFIMASEEESINICLVGAGKTALVEIVLSESSRNKVAVWNVMYTYVNTVDEIYISLDYYFSSYADITDTRDFDEWVSQLSSLTIIDIEWVLTELGYDVE